MNKIGIMLSIVTISALVIGCGSSSATNTQVAEVNTTGVVVDDYISGATVCVDVNKNGIADDEPNCVQTDNQGGFNFGKEVTGTLVMQGGFDIGTGKAFEGTFSAPSGSTVINPLTTIVQAMVASGRTVTEAQNIIKATLGLPDVDLTTYDPIAEVTFGADTASKEVARTMLAQQSNIQVILTIVSSTIASADSENLTQSEVTAQATAQIAALMTAAPANTLVSINSASSIETILNATASTALAGNADAIADISAVAEAVSQQVETIAQLVVTNINAIEVSGDAENTETGLEALAASNTILSLVTTTGAGSIMDTIKEAVSSGNTDNIAAIDIEEAVDAIDLPTRPDVTPPSDDTPPVVIPVTGGEGGN